VFFQTSDERGFSRAAGSDNADEYLFFWVTHYRALIDLALPVRRALQVYSP
jgi:hypothetical protein